MIRHAQVGKHYLRTEELNVKGSDLHLKVDELMHEEKVRRIILRDGAGHDLIEIPLMGGLDESTAKPILAAAGAIGVAAGEEMFVVEKEFEVEEDETVQD
jgi:hypothetical protein